MSEPTGPAMTAEEAERHFRRTLATRLRNGRVPDAPQWDDDAVREFMAVANAYAAGYARECIAALRPVMEGRAADAGDGTVSGPATEAKAAAVPAPKLPRRTKAAAQT